MPSYQEYLLQLDADPIWGQLEAELGVKSRRGVHTSSEIADYTVCPQMASLKYGYEGLPSVPEIRHLKAARGSAVHKTIERLHKEKAWDWIPDLYQESWDAEMNDPEQEGVSFFREEKLIEPDRSGRTEIDKVRDDGLVMVQNYAGFNRHADVEAVELSGRMLVRHPGGKVWYRLALTIDQLRPAPGKNPHPQVQMPRPWEVWDLKSSEKAPSQDWLARSKQFTIYGLGIREARFVLPSGETEKFGEHPARFVWYHLHHLVPYKRKTGDKAVGDLRGDPEIETFRTDADYTRMRADIGRIFQAISMKMFYRSEGKAFLDNCAACPVRHACEAGSPTAGMQMADMEMSDGF